jgi:hypothetical protein
MRNLLLALILSFVVPAAAGAVSRDTLVVKRNLLPLSTKITIGPLLYFSLWGYEQIDDDDEIEVELYPNVG